MFNFYNCTFKDDCQCPECERKRIIFDSKITEIRLVDKDKQPKMVECDRCGNRILINPPMQNHEKEINDVQKIKTS